VEKKWSEGANLQGKDVAASPRQSKSPFFRKFAEIWAVGEVI